MFVCQLHICVCFVSLFISGLSVFFCIFLSRSLSFCSQQYHFSLIHSLLFIIPSCPHFSLSSTIYFVSLPTLSSLSFLLTSFSFYFSLLYSPFLLHPFISFPLRSASFSFPNPPLCPSPSHLPSSSYFYLHFTLFHFFLNIYPFPIPCTSLSYVYVYLSYFSFSPSVVILPNQDDAGDKNIN